MRIAICGIHIESSTFSPHRSSEADFEVRRGRALLERYPFLDADWAAGVEWLPVLHARALPGGPALAATYAAWRDEITAGLSALGPIDGVFFDIHGAMSVEGLTDAEGDLISAIRAVIGPGPLVASGMDLHGNVSGTLFTQTDLLTCYRTAPHVDVWETRERAARHLVRAIRSGGRPAKALVHLPFLLPGEMTSTRVDPARSLYADVARVAATPGVWDAAFWIGFAWADEPRCQAAVVVLADQQPVADEQALGLAGRIWEQRHEFGFVAPVASFADCLDAALRSPRRPFFISDSGDNPGAGGACDVTVALAETLRHPELASGDALTVLIAAIADPDAVTAAARAGIGASARFPVGGRLDDRPPGPVTAVWRVQALAEDPHGGQVALLRHGQTGLIVTSRRDQYATLDKFRLLGIDPHEVPVVVVKIGYLEPELYEAAADWLMALTPGGVDQDLPRLGHRRLQRPMIPFDADADGPRVFRGQPT
ncbi:MAG: M81 family metallopeptidase [Propionibacteriaceae bacterium]|nr:M81 family metallopeptidase [Propionibacteriaceae bacterium]